MECKSSEQARALRFPSAAIRDSLLASEKTLDDQIRIIGLKAILPDELEHNVS